MVKRVTEEDWKRISATSKDSGFVKRVGNAYRNHKEEVIKTRSGSGSGSSRGSNANNNSGGSAGKLGGSSRDPDTPKGSKK